MNPSIRQLQNQNNKKERQSEAIGVCSQEAYFLLVQPEKCWSGSVQAIALLAVQRTTKHDDLPNSAARGVSADENKQINTKSEQQERSHFWRQK